nr:hypothetical protein [Akkermansia glycaniphila]
MGGREDDGDEGSVVGGVDADVAVVVFGYPAEEVMPAFAGAVRFVVVEEAFGDDVSYVAFRDAFAGGSVGPSFFLFPISDVLGDPRGAEGCGVVRAEGAADVEPCRGEVPGSGVALGGVFVLREVDASPGSRFEDGGRAAGVESAAVVEEDGDAVFIDGVGGVGGVELPVSEPLFEGGGGGRFNV